MYRDFSHTSCPHPCVAPHNQHSPAHGVFVTTEAPTLTHHYLPSFFILVFTRLFNTYLLTACLILCLSKLFFHSSSCFFSSLFSKCAPLLLFLFLRHYLFLERGEEREKGRERNTNVWLLRRPPLVQVLTECLRMKTQRSGSWQA